MSISLESENTCQNHTYMIAQWFRYLTAELEAGSLIPDCASLTGAGLDNPQGPFQLCNSKVIIISLSFLFQEVCTKNITHIASSILY